MLLSVPIEYKKPDEGFLFLIVIQTFQFKIMNIYWGFLTGKVLDSVYGICKDDQDSQNIDACNYPESDVISNSVLGSELSAF